MEFDLGTLHRGEVSSISIDGSYDLPEDYYKNTDIIHLSSLRVEGSIIQKENDDFELEDYAICNIQGVMVLPDSISLEEVEYPFTISYDDFISENCIKNENILDIFTFLWENTVLEVPLQFTKVSDLSKFHGDGWRLISEDEHFHQNRPFSDLLKDYDKE